jgi:AraC-like DNA-binding protein
MKPIRYFFRTPPVQSHALTIHGLGIGEVMPPGQVDRPEGMGDYLFMFFSDAVIVETKNEPRECPPGTAMIWEPHRSQIYGRDGRRWRHSWLHCDGRLIARFVRDLLLPVQQPFLASSPSSQFDPDNHLIQLHRELTECTPPDAAIARNLIENLLRDLARSARAAESTAAAGNIAIPPTLSALRAYLDVHYDEPMQLPALAERANYSVPHLCALFKQHFGRPVMQYLIDVRLHQAACLLQDRALAVKEVAQRVGYSDLFYFSKLFKSRYKLSPTRYRQSNADRPPLQFQPGFPAST